MWHPDEELLADVALGEPVDASLADHVASCAACAATVDDLRLTRELTRVGIDRVTWQSPPGDLWSRIEAELDAEDQGPQAPTELGPSPTQPDVVVPLARPRTPRATWPRLASWVLGAAAAGLAFGLLAGRMAWGGPPEPETTTIATAELDTLDTRQPRGEAFLLRVADEVDLKVQAEPLDAGNGYLEVWLINKDGKRMVSVGVLRGGEADLFPVTQALIDQGYVIVDVSREGFDDDATHSGDSLVRGTLST